MFVRLTCFISLSMVSQSIVLSLSLDLRRKLILCFIFVVQDGHCNPGRYRRRCSGRCRDNRTGRLWYSKSLRTCLVMGVVVCYYVTIGGPLDTLGGDRWIFWNP